MGVLACRGGEGLREAEGCFLVFVDVDAGGEGLVREAFPVGVGGLLSKADRRVVALWAADCAERALPLFEAETPDDDRVRDGVARARAFSRGELDAAGEIRRRFEAGRAAQSVKAPAAVAAARAAGQASGVAHMGAHALGAAAYAAKAAALAASDQEAARHVEVRWQLDHLTMGAREALSRLPLLGEDASGPLGRGLLATGILAVTIREIQAELSPRRRR